MQLRQATRNAYIAFLRTLPARSIPFNIEQLLREAEVDLKLGTYLKKSAFLSKQPGDSLYLANFNNEQVDLVLENFVKYRSNLEEANRTDKADLDYYRANKDFLVDSRTLNQINSPEAARIKEETKKALIKEISEYAAMAVKFNKTDIVGFITTMLNTK